MQHEALAPSAWICRWLHRLRAGGDVLDVACGAGRHARIFAERGHRVYAVDRDGDAISSLQRVPGIQALQADIEAGPWPYAGRAFDAIVVTNYLFRPLLPVLIDALAPNGALLYETFAAGNERYGRPTNPAFLLEPGELLDAVRGHLRVIAFEDLYVEQPKPAMVQRICAERTRVS
jgi:SAM-dependent methyltransferase